MEPRSGETAAPAAAEQPRPGEGWRKDYIRSWLYERGVPAAEAVAGKAVLLARAGRARASAVPSRRKCPAAPCRRARAVPADARRPGGAVLHAPTPQTFTPCALPFRRPRWPRGTACGAPPCTPHARSPAVAGTSPTSTAGCGCAACCSPQGWARPTCWWGWAGAAPAGIGCRRQGARVATGGGGGSCLRPAGSHVVRHVMRASLVAVLLHEMQAARHPRPAPRQELARDVYHGHTEGLVSALCAPVVQWSTSAGAERGSPSRAHGPARAVGAPPRLCLVSCHEQCTPKRGAVP